MFKGSDIAINVTLESAVSDYTNVICYIVHRRTKEIKTKFSILNLSGYEDIEIVDAANGIIKLKWMDSETVDAKSGIYQLEVMVFKSDSDYDDNSFDDIAVSDLTGTMQDVQIKSEA